MFNIDFFHKYSKYNLYVWHYMNRKLNVIMQVKTCESTKLFLNYVIYKVLEHIKF
jgi:hypothetical protein